MVLLGVDMPLQNIVVGAVLVLVVWVDSLYCRCIKKYKRIMPTNATSSFVEMRNISIAFGGIKAVDGVSRRSASRRGGRPARP